MSKTPVLAPVAGRAVPLSDVPDPVFSHGHGGLRRGGRSAARE